MWMLWLCTDCQLNSIIHPLTSYSWQRSVTTIAKTSGDVSQVRVWVYILGRGVHPSTLRPRNPITRIAPKDLRKLLQLEGRIDTCKESRRALFDRPIQNILLALHWHCNAISDQLATKYRHAKSGRGLQQPRSTRCGYTYQINVYPMKFRSRHHRSLVRQFTCH